MITSSGTHAVGVELGNGWWNPLPLLFWGHDNLRDGLMSLQGRTSSEPMFRLLVLATMSDGTEKVLASSDSPADWKSGGSPTTFNNIYLGEKYDARMEAAAAGWAGGVSGGKFDASSWTAPVVAKHKLGAMVAQSVPPIRRIGEITPTLISTSSVADSAGTTTTILDTGKNHAGTCRFRFTGSAPGGGTLSPCDSASCCTQTAL